MNLTKDEIKKIIISKPEELATINDTLMPQLINDFDNDEFAEYLNKTKAERANCTKYHSKIEEIKSVFSYKTIIGNKYDLAEILDQHTCVYCNRNYVKTIGNTEKKIIRAEYDHFFSQSKYPLLALSFYNLIPICSNCNKKKLDKNFKINTHLNPYLISVEDKKFSFSFRKKNLIENNVKINIETKNTESVDKINNTFTDLSLIEIYQAHSDKELQDLLNLRYKYSENYLEILLNNTFTNLHLSLEEAYRMLFGIEVEEENYHKRPFSKFKKDIIDELLKIK